MRKSVSAMLIDLNDEYFDLILEWRNKEKIRKVMFNSEIITLEQHKEWFLKQKNSHESINKIFLLNNVPIGFVNINNLSLERNTGYWGFYIGVEDTPKGVGKVLGFTALNYIFNELNFRKISAEVIGNNEISSEFHTKLGFQKEGTLRKHIIKNDKEEDVLLFGIFKEEWLEKSIVIKKEIEGMKL